MAKKRNKKSRGMKMQPAVTDIYLKTDPTGAGTNNLWYVDTAKQLSKINRRLYSQTRLYGYQGLTFIWKQNAAAPTVATLEVKVATAGNTWIVQNAYTKGHALWNQMQDLVLEDNPSIKGTWHDFKIQLSDSASTPRSLEALAGDGGLYLDGEWNLATYVMPQHQVSDGTQIDPDTGLPIPMGEPLPAVELTATLIGGDTASKRSLVKAYQESRATVQPFDPAVPAAMSTSFFNLLTDSGSQEPELADVIEGENDEPPYDQGNYPGGEINADSAVIVGYGAISASEVDGRIGGFVAPCGLLEIQINGYLVDGTPVDDENMPEIELLLHVAPGAYKGVAAIPMGQ
jgi:hypothetical protein